MRRVHNFSAGPAALPDPVRDRLGELFAVPSDRRPSLVEVSHRGRQFAAVAEELLERLKRLMALGQDHAVLLLQGGANLQFAWVPMNLAANRTAAYLITGHWGRRALAEAERVGRAVVAGDSAVCDYTAIPEIGHLPTDCAYLHYTGNETIHGVQFDLPPAVGVPLAADLSSEFLSRPYPYRDLGLAYAGAQKNLGVAGLTVVVIRHDLLKRIPEGLPKYFDYRTWVASDSLYNTPCSFAWVVALEVLRWIDDAGGLAVIGERNAAKADALYQAIDGSDFYHNGVEPGCRSQMNVPFRLANHELESRFVAEAEQVGMPGLKGHRALGGIRASLYNALSSEAVESLVEFMVEFERRYG